MPPGPISVARDGRPNAPHRCERSEALLQPICALATSVLLLAVPFTAVGSSELPANELGGSFDLAGERVDVQLHPGNASPGATAVAGEGSVRTVLPYDGRLTLRLPYVVGESAALGNAQVAASFDLAKERVALPSLGLTARVDLPTAPGARAPCPGVKAVATKKLELGVLEAIHAEGELWTDGPRLAPCHRTALGATLRLHKATHATLELVSVRAHAGATAVRQDSAQIGVSHRVGGTGLHAGVAAIVAGNSTSLRASFGIEQRF
jgi:hypothetical protein